MLPTLIDWMRRLNTRSRAEFFACVVWISSIAIAANAQEDFPGVRGGGKGGNETSGWTQTAVAVVGDVTNVINVINVGGRDYNHLPPPMFPDVHKLYWCEGDFKVIAVVKGELRGQSRKYLWASAWPDCRLYASDPAMIASRYQTRVWFLREEGDFLRPTYDYGGAKFLGLCESWSDGPPLPAKSRLSAMLLDPAASCATMDEYAEYLWLVGDIACELDKKACISSIRTLAHLGSVKLREHACNYLKAQQETSCDP